MPLLRKHFQCKSQKLQEASASVVLPQEDHAMCCPLLANLTCFGQHQLTHPGQKQCLYQNNPCAYPGVSASALLPEALQLLHVQSSDKVAELTFTFTSQLSGLKCACLRDTGAAKSIISSNFVAQYGLGIKSSDKRTIVQADGSSKDAMGTCKVKLQVQKRCSKDILNFTDLVSGFDVMLRRDWSQHHCV
jgi:hypothetical protein